MSFEQFWFISSRLVNMTVNKNNENPSIQQTKSDIFTSLSSTTGSKEALRGDESLKKPVCKDPSHYQPLKKEDNGTWSLKDSPGGLASALLGIKDFEVVYIGWAGLSKPKNVDDLNALTSAFASKKCVPVFIEEEIKDKYYDGYCNSILWPLFHYLGIPQEDRLDTIQSQFEAYETANKFFAEVVIENYKAGDIVWCHDYHLMFLPEYLKKHNSEMKVGWFLHTSFPSSEVYMILPHRTDLLYAVLHADLVGFQTYDYARHFVSACNRILGLEGTPEGVDDCGKLTRVAAFPVGIDPDRFIKRIALPEVQKRIDCLISELSGRKVLLGVDRLDMIKGIPQKLLAFEKFLEDNAKLCDKVVLMQIAVPTRTEVPEYKKLASQVHEIVGRINGRFGTLTKFPIHHLDRSLDFAELCALYAITDVALVTSLRDGMNLVSYEFVACQELKKGVLILSEFAGAAQSLGAGAILVNPWNITEVASSIKKALDMSNETRETQHQRNFNHVKTHTSQHWAEVFISKMNDTAVKAHLSKKLIPSELPSKEAVEGYNKAKNRLLILGFNGTLTDPVGMPGTGGPDQDKEKELKLHPELMESLRILCEDPNTTVLIVSGSDRDVLENNFREYNMWLAAENGMFLARTTPELDWVMTMPEHPVTTWNDKVKLVFDYFSERTPEARYKIRQNSLVWIYKHLDDGFGRVQARNLLQELWGQTLSSTGVDVVPGGESVEVRLVNVTKDEDIYRFFEPKPPTELAGSEGPQVSDQGQSHIPKISHSPKLTRSLSGITLASEVPVVSESLAGTPHLSTSADEKRLILNLKTENYFSCAVKRECSKARYKLESSDKVVELIKELAAVSTRVAAESS
ncbi:hypothetical protein IFM89_028682 [Coptis chinensis]|uniref:alpha,alpha-trehalose-phosphate synthase (UDP-forming) n=1 Tax=Coptis chinensis TaxID=261450 RepID=A0A835H1E9_9MAGN|nr:hypothetical protein IFM89_028682 [Coptis chinensis]